VSATPELCRSRPLILVAEDEAIRPLAKGQGPKGGQWEEGLTEHLKAKGYLT